MRESNYWLRILSKIDNEEKVNSFLNESNELKKILGSIYSKSSIKK